MKRLVVLVLAAAGVTFIGLAILSRTRRPESTWEPGLEFNPDFDLTVEEILDDLRGDAPSA